MTTNHGHESYGHENDEPRNPGVGFDKSDLGARGILIFFVVLGVFSVAAQLGVLGIYVGMTKFADKHEKEPMPLAPKAVIPRGNALTNTADVNTQRFSQPRLQTDDTSDMERFLLKETTTLAAKPWQDSEGNVHLPIEQAMKEVGSRLPVRAGGTAPPNYPGASMRYSYFLEQAEGTAAQDEAQHGNAAQMENQMGNLGNQANPSGDK